MPSTPRNAGNLEWWRYLAYERSYWPTTWPRYPEFEYLPSRLDVILHDAHLAEAGDVVPKAYVDTRAELIAAHLETIWVICDVLPADKRAVKSKLVKLLKQS